MRRAPTAAYLLWSMDRAEALCAYFPKATTEAMRLDLTAFHAGLLASAIRPLAARTPLNRQGKRQIDGDIAVAIRRMFG